ncbi:MAG: putative sulfate exporter family transporter, partial [Mycobacterium sp.]|nr:putative sulfate exporter family transporter [Mycobacterium sp.]
MVTGISTVRVEPDETAAETAFTSTRPLDYVPGVVLLIAV